MLNFATEYPVRRTLFRDCTEYVVDRANVCLASHKFPIPYVFVPFFLTVVIHTQNLMSEVTRITLMGDLVTNSEPKQSPSPKPPDHSGTTTSPQPPQT